MIDRLLAARSPIAIALVKLQEMGSVLPPALSDEEWKALKDLGEVLRAAKEALTCIQNQNVPTIGILYPLIQGLIRTIRDYVPASLTNDSLFRTMIAVFQQTVVAYVKSRFDLLLDAWDEELTLSTFLDPITKDFFFITDSIQREQLRAKAIAFAAAQIPEEEVVCSGSTQTFESSILVRLIGQQCLESISTSNTANEIQMYNGLPRLPWMTGNKQANPLEWWAANANHYPGLASLARRYLALLPSSASIERAFSHAGWVVDKRRCNLSDKTVETRLFLIADKEHIVL